MADTANSKLWVILLGVVNLLMLVLMTVIGFVAKGALSDVKAANEKIIRFEENIGETDFGALVLRMQQIAEDDALDVEQNRRLDALHATDRKFWRIANTHKDWMNEHRDDNEPRVIWPDFGDIDQ